ncbi:hypothetical protein PLIP_a3444 [Pseudoalteromonas lipolytica LMEB 39]|nr:hypothetical protein [Pseudoalteromonas lipolytica LMEB 39]
MGDVLAGSAEFIFAVITSLFVMLASSQPKINLSEQLTTLE